MKDPESKPKQKFVVQRMFGVESDTPEQAVEMTASKVKDVTSISINVQPAVIAQPLRAPEQPTAASKNLAEQRRGPKHTK